MNITFQGNPITLVGKELKVGDKAPNFMLTNSDLQPVTLNNTSGVRIFVVVPSIDTGVCDLEVQTFNQKAGEVPGVNIYTISMDLPFAQARWCGAKSVKSLTMLSDYKDHSFGNNYGTYIKELGLLTRAVFVIDSSNTVTYAEYVSEVTEQPNFEQVIKAAKEAK
ncbi:MAG: thiol peroxidase [Clostridium argentinense]|uniref:Thiol peroxidase n=1 Tax=Clostridium faecium TaxID=2762223 RepID=A0ABR8YPB3_9CLOT|nr:MULTISPECIES: thiol peroxidase [Clostridium]MBD8046093.1 thiol peroxidase [Clostridium faecium]MBS5824756.1 thiol peroxidase [Clostridium argentinense]MDU1349584.1 thiol peroxidase [Clostridium argentinense]